MVLILLFRKFSCSSDPFVSFPPFLISVVVGMDDELDLVLLLLFYVILGHG